jgi:hypothetical protein
MVHRLSSKGTWKSFPSWTRFACSCSPVRGQSTPLLLCACAVFSLHAWVLTRLRRLELLVAPLRLTSCRCTRGQCLMLHMCSVVTWLEVKCNARSLPIWIHGPALHMACPPDFLIYSTSLTAAVWVRLSPTLTRSLAGDPIKRPFNRGHGARVPIKAASVDYPLQSASTHHQLVCALACHQPPHQLNVVNK